MVKLYSLLAREHTPEIPSPVSRGIDHRNHDHDIRPGLYIAFAMILLVSIGCLGPYAWKTWRNKKAVQDPEKVQDPTVAQVETAKESGSGAPEIAKPPAAARTAAEERFISVFPFGAYHPPTGR